MSLESTQPLTEMSARNISSDGKGGRRLRLSTLPPSCAVVMKSGNLNLLEPSGPIQACSETAVNIFSSPRSVRFEVVTAGNIRVLPSDRTMVLGSTPPLTEMSTRGISSGDKGSRRVRLTTLPQSCAVVTKSGNLNFLEPSGPLQACNGTDVNIFIPVHSVRLEVLTAGSIQALCAWWQSTQRLYEI